MRIGLLPTYMAVTTVTKVSVPINIIIIKASRRAGSISSLHIALPILRDLFSVLMLILPHLRGQLVLLRLSVRAMTTQDP